MRAQKWVIAAAFGLIVGAAVTEAQANLASLRIQDRTPVRSADTNYSFSPACCTDRGTYIATVPYTVTAVQVRAPTVSSSHSTL